MTTLKTGSDLPTVADFLDEATARLDRFAKQRPIPGTDVYELYRLCAHLTAALRMLADTGREAAETTTSPRLPRLSDHAPQPPATAPTCTNARFQPVNPTTDKEPQP